jgi:hypothetical protein
MTIQRNDAGRTPGQGSSEPAPIHRGSNVYDESRPRQAAAADIAEDAATVAYRMEGSRGAQATGPGHMSTAPVFGRPIQYGGARECPHRRRVLGRFRFLNGTTHVCDWCLCCGARSELISRRDLAAAGISWATVPLVRDNEAPAEAA